MNRMNEVQKAKHTYSIHQDGLLWSRVQVLIAIQSATIAGTYYLVQKGQTLYACLLTALGLVLTVLLWIIAERDQLHREQSLALSGVEPTELAVGFPFAPKGAIIIRIVILLLMYADVVVVLVPYAERWVIALTLTALGFAFAMLLFEVTGRADREVERIRDLYRPAATAKRRKPPEG
jgi:amino acid permease